MSRGQLLWGYRQSVACWNPSLFTQKWVIGWVYLICGLCSWKTISRNRHNCFQPHCSLERVNPSNFATGHVMEHPPASFRKVKEQVERNLSDLHVFVVVYICVTYCFSGGPQRKPHSSIEVVNFVLIFYCFSSMQCFSLNSVTSLEWRQCTGPIYFSV